MKYIGLIGGVSPEATQIYYRHLNAHAREKLGGQHSAAVTFQMLDYGEMIGHYAEENWVGFKEQVVTAAQVLKAAGVDALAITSGTTHMGAAAAAEATGLPVIHMLDSLASAMKARGVKKPLLLGTAFTMSGDFFRPALLERYDGNPLTPAEVDQALVERIIRDELVEGLVDSGSKAAMIDLVNRYAAEGCDGVILGCTELCMILEQADCDVEVLNVTAIHAAAIADVMFG
jgi:aspartate racemase